MCLASRMVTISLACRPQFKLERINSLLERAISTRYVALYLSQTGQICNFQTPVILLKMITDELFFNLSLG